jgi:hypothetical protein
MDRCKEVKRERLEYHLYGQLFYLVSDARANTTRKQKELTYMSFLHHSNLSSFVSSSHTTGKHPNIYKDPPPNSTYKRKIGEVSSIQEKDCL